MGGGGGLLAIGGFRATFPSFLVAAGRGGMLGGFSPVGGWGAGLTGANGVNVSDDKLGLEPAPNRGV